MSAKSLLIALALAATAMFFSYQIARSETADPEFYIHVVIVTPNGIEQLRSTFSYKTMAECEADLPARKAAMENNIQEKGAPISILDMQCGPLSGTE